MTSIAGETAAIGAVGIPIRPALVEVLVLLLGGDFALMNLVELFEGSTLKTEFALSLLLVLVIGHQPTSEPA